MKPENLLIFNVKEGWGPLCDFLELPVPMKKFPLIRETVQIKPEAFPNMNDTAQFKRGLIFFRGYIAVAKWAAYGARAAIVGGVAYAGWRLLSR